MSKSRHKKEHRSPEHSSARSPAETVSAASSGIPAGAVTSTPSVHALAFQSDYACANTGKCCRNWRIPVDSEVHDRIARELAEKRITIPAGHNNEDVNAEAQFFESNGGRTLLAQCGSDCVFLEPGPGGLCAVHRDAGPASLPWPCRVFPRLCIIEPAGVRLVLSNYCPTAAAMLFRSDMDDAAALRIVHDPAAFPPSAGYAGLDARQHAPPLLRKGIPMSWETYAQWESHAVGFLGQDDYTPEEALIILATTAEKARAATPAQAQDTQFFGSLYVAALEADPAPLRAQIAALPTGAARCRHLHQLILEFTSPEKGIYETWFAGYNEMYRNQAGGDAETDAATRYQNDYERWVRLEWPAFASPLRRWLAGRLFASYHGHQGDGLRTAVFAAAGALAALRVHTTLACARAARPLDRALFLEAVQITDYLIEHAADKARLARFFSQIETLPLMELLGPIPA